MEKKILKTSKTKSPLLENILKNIPEQDLNKIRNRMIISARIEDCMKKEGLNKIAFANKMGKHPSEITKWLSGTQNFTTDTLTEIATILNATIADLVKDQKELKQMKFNQKTVLISVMIENLSPKIEPITPLIRPAKHRYFYSESTRGIPFITPKTFLA